MKHSLQVQAAVVATLKHKQLYNGNDGGGAGAGECSDLNCCNFETTIMIIEDKRQQWLNSYRINSVIQ